MSTCQPSIFQLETSWCSGLSWSCKNGDLQHRPGEKSGMFRLQWLDLESIKTRWDLVFFFGFKHVLWIESINQLKLDGYFTPFFHQSIGFFFWCMFFNKETPRSRSLGPKSSPVMPLTWRCAHSERNGSMSEEKTITQKSFFFFFGRTAIEGTLCLHNT